METKTINVVRQEEKYPISYFDYVDLSQRLSNVLLEDPNNGQGGYRVRSLYFDSYRNTDFYEKLSGMENRKKIRLRIYSPDDEKVKLEIKKKFGGSQVKDTVVISREDAKRLIDMDYEALLNYKSDVARTIYNIMKIDRLRPVVLIEYRRKAFIHPMNEIRLTLDTDIRSSETNFDFFGQAPVLIPTDDYFMGILEVKYNGFIFKWITDILTPFDLNRESYSKYMVSKGIFEKFMA